MEWTNERVITFIEKLHTEPCLWDPKNKGYKNRATQNDAWRRILKLLPFNTSIEEMKKKKESLMGYYRTHLNKYRKTKVYTTNWFAFEIMDSFLRVVYDNNCSLNLETNDDNDTQERTEGEYDRNEISSHMSLQIEEPSQDLLRGILTHQKENKSSQNSCLKVSGTKRQSKDDMPVTIEAKRYHIDEANEHNNDDECELFGKLIASKLKKIRNPNTRDVLMNDIYNIVFRKCMADRLDRIAEEPEYLNRTNPCTSASQSPQHRIVFSPPKTSIYQSPSDSTSSQSQHQVITPSPNLSSYQIFPDPIDLQSVKHETYSPSP